MLLIEQGAFLFRFVAELLVKTPGNLGHRPRNLLRQFGGASAVDRHSYRDSAF